MSGSSRDESGETLTEDAIERILKSVGRNLVPQASIEPCCIGIWSTSDFAIRMRQCFTIKRYHGSDRRGSSKFERPLKQSLRWTMTVGICLRGRDSVTRRPTRIARSPASPPDG
jgi:hypothetical protein